MSTPDLSKAHASSDLTLHKAVFDNDLKKVAKILRHCDSATISEKDVHGKLSF